jgi:hypothetical protein
MSEVTDVYTMLVRLGFIMESTHYLTGDADIGSLEEIAYLDGKGDVEIITKRLNHPGGSTNFGTGANSVTTPHSGYAVYIQADSDLKLCVFYLKHNARFNRVPTVGGITFETVFSFKDQQRWEMD